MPDLERVMVACVGRREGGFLVSLLRAPARGPGDASPRLASHTAQHWDFSGFRGQEAAVIGAGQSALQAAALPHEHGADPGRFVRGEGAWFSSKAERRPLLETHEVPQLPGRAGPFQLVLEHIPLGFHYLHEDFRVSKIRSHLGPLGAWWLRDRVEGKVPVHVRHRLIEARPHGSRVLLRFQVDGASSARF